MKAFIVAVLCALIGFCAEGYVSPVGKPSALPQHEVVYPRSLQSDCAITATEAFTRLRPTGVWTRICVVTLLSPTGVAGHAITVWEPFQGSPLFVYDLYFFNSTMIFHSCGRDAAKLVAALNHTQDLADKHITVLSAQFIE